MRRQLVAAQGGMIDFVDLTLICEAPKVEAAPGGHAHADRGAVAAFPGPDQR